MAAKSLLARVKGLFQPQTVQPEGPCVQIHLEEILARCSQPLTKPEVAQSLTQLVGDCAAKPGEEARLASDWLERFALADAISLLGQLPEAEAALVLLWPYGQQQDCRSQLVACLRHETGDAALAAARVIPQLQDPRLVPLLLPALLEDMEYVVARVAEALAGCGAGAAAAMVVLYQKDDCDCRPLLLEVFATMDPAFCPAEVVTAAVQDPDPAVRQGAARLLGRWGRKADLPLLEQLLQDKSPRVRGAVAMALGQIGGNDCIKLLHQLDEQEDWQTQQAKAFALKRLGHSKPAPKGAEPVAKKGRKGRKKGTEPPTAATTQQGMEDAQ